MFFEHILLVIDLREQFTGGCPIVLFWGCFWFFCRSTERLPFDRLRAQRALSFRMCPELVEKGKVSHSEAIFACLCLPVRRQAGMTENGIFRLSSNLNLQMHCNYLILLNIYQKRVNLLKAQVTSHYNAVKRHSGAFYDCITLKRLTPIYKTIHNVSTYE